MLLKIAFFLFGESQRIFLSFGYTLWWIST